MIFARLYRTDLVNGDPLPVGRPVMMRGSVPHLHLMATMAAKREGATCYRIYDGRTFQDANPISLMHDVSE